MENLSIAVVGATGVVGRAIVNILEEKKLPFSEYTFFASKRSSGEKINFMGKEHVINELTEKSFNSETKYNIALFAAGSEISKKYVPIAAASGCVVIDNSSFWRMEKNVPLVVPEVNPEDILWNKGVIANPNCSTIQAVVALKPLHDKYGIKRIVYSTYQAVSGAGMGGLQDLKKGLQNMAEEKVQNETELVKFPFPIAGNCLPHIDSFSSDGYTNEELKMILETRKILHDDSLKVTATTVRVPVFSAHSESVNVEFENPFEIEELIETLRNANGIVVQNNVSDPKTPYPMAINATGKDEVFVGRIRRDFSVENGVNLWIVADNVRKGAALNAIQIAELLIKDCFSSNE